MALEQSLRNEEYLHIPYVLMVWSTPGPGDDWVCHAEYPELPGCSVEHANALVAIERLDAMKDDLILDRLARGEEVPTPRPPLRA
jgi:hypothetical protein